MASQDHSRARFVPIPPGFDLHSLVQCAENIGYVTRLSREKLKHYTLQSIEALVYAVVVQGGRPLVIEGWGSSLPSSLFSRKWLEDSLGERVENIRDISNETNIPMTIGHYLRSMEKLTEQFSTSNYKETKHQRLYLKDMDCPDAWAKHLKEIIPESVFYLNECITYETDESSTSCDFDQDFQFRTNKVIAPSGDLMSSLPPEMRALNLMCYIGHDGTYTAAHREMCATVGHNIMIEASEDASCEREGSSIWFMTETKDREIVHEYFSAVLGHDVDVEKHFAQINAWKKAPFNVWVVEQKVGDLIIIPPLAPHQVWNCGTRTIKVAWNRTTIDTLELALHESLPNYRMVCRDEQYKCKAIIYYTLEKYYKVLQHNTTDEKIWLDGQPQQLLDDYKRLFYLYQEILLSEMFSSNPPEERIIEMLQFDSHVTCSYCRCNIFNRFLTCKICNSDDLGEEDDTYDICMDCYAMGRSCACISNLSWVEQWDWETLVNNHELWRNVIDRLPGSTEKKGYTQPLKIVKIKHQKKSIAEICQEQLNIRPWRNTDKPNYVTPSCASNKKKRKKRNRLNTLRTGRKAKLQMSKKNVQNCSRVKRHLCHVCRRYDCYWKMAFCSSCNLAYCYSVLWLEFDLMPQTVMADSNWHCPRCLKICSCQNCRQISIQTPYRPKKMYLGHDTKKFADCRSVESLVDFSQSKIGWFYDDVDNHKESLRIKRLKEKVEAEKTIAEKIRETETIESRKPNSIRSSKKINLTARQMKYIDPFLRDLNVSEPHQYEQDSESKIHNKQDHSLVDGNMSTEFSNLFDFTSGSCVRDTNIDNFTRSNDIYGQEIKHFLPLSPYSVIIDNTADQNYPNPTHISEYFTKNTDV